MSAFFEFEADFVQDLRCIPMQVRMKLDTCGVKLKLNHWSHFTLSEKEQLLSTPCDTPKEQEQYRELLCALVLAQTGMLPGNLPIEPHPPWRDETDVPALVQEKAESLGVQLSREQWGKLTPLQRFALVKLSRPSHENYNFLPALREFELLP